MDKKLSAIILAVVLVLGMCSCNEHVSETNSIESNLKQINKGIAKFSELKNGTVEVNSSLRAEKNAVESLDTSNTENTSLTTFILNQKGYDYIDERAFLNEKTREAQYSAAKQVHGTTFHALPVDPFTIERIKPYEWQNTSEISRISYEPNATLKMMSVPAKLLGNEEYIETVTKEKNGSFMKYTVTTNDTYAKYMKEDVHSAEENYIVNVHREIYWINKDDLLIKHQSYDEIELTIDGIADRYILEVTVELTGYNYKKLIEIGNELPPMIMFKGELYTQSPVLLDIDLNELIEIGTIECIVGSVQEPEQNNQANRCIKNATIYGGGKKGIIVKYSDYTLYEKNS